MRTNKELNVDKLKRKREAKENWNVENTPEQHALYTHFTPGIQS